MIIKIKKNIKDSINLKKKLVKFSDQIINSVALISETILNDGRIFLCGNGGSAADAQHLAAEFLIRLKKMLKEKLGQQSV